jgi:polyferredoxin
MKRDWKHYLFVITIIFFILGFFNIIFAWLGFVCMISPFVFLAKDGKKTWCQNYCPRSKLLSVLFKNRSITGKAGPSWLIKGKAKWFVFAYFIFNMLVLIMSTIMVYSGKIAPLENVRVLLAFNMPWDMPNLLNLGNFPGWAVHLSFRVYSMMLTTTIFGLLLAWIFKPRTWCTVCPINTASDVLLKINKKCNY